MMHSAAATTSVRLVSTPALAASAALVSVFSGWALVSRPTWAFLAPALLIGLLLVADARARFVVVIAGGLLVLQGSDALTDTKLAYLGAVAIAFGGAVIRLLYAEQTPAVRMARPLLLASSAFLMMVALSLPVALAYGNFKTEWLRDVAPYALFGAAPVLAIDAHAAFSPRWLRRILVAAGSLALVSYIVEWTLRRSILDLPISRVALPSFLLAAALVSFGMAVALAGRSRTLVWLGLTTLALALLPLTGSRSTVAVLAAPLVIALIARRGRLRRSLRLGVVAPVVAVLAALMLQFVVQASGADTKMLADRVTALVSFGEQSDQSYRERQIQLDVSWEAFLSAPMAGIGPGAAFDWQRSGDPWLIVDTPVSFLAKFGVLGLGVVLFIALCYVRFLRDVRKAAGDSVGYFALAGYLGVVAAWSVLYVPFEDKGSGLGLSILLALVLAEIHARTQAQASMS